MELAEAPYSRENEHVIIIVFFFCFFFVILEMDSSVNNLDSSENDLESDSNTNAKSTPKKRN